VTKFETAGPPRYAHQKRGLRKMIQTGGITALLFDPGTGKTPVALDYASLLALKSPRNEARLLVVCPLAAVDTWVMLAEKYVSPQVHYWAEALGGSILERGEALAARGGNPLRKLRSLQRGSGANARQRVEQHPRALHHRRSIVIGYRASSLRPVPMTLSEGPDGLGSDKPRLLIEIINIDALASRDRVPGLKSQNMADFMLDAIRRYEPDLVVVDESHKIKSANGNASKLMARVSRHVPRRAILTGTVMPHSPMDVFGQWRFLDPLAFGSKKADGTMQLMTVEDFRSRYAVMGGFFGQQITGFQNLDDMQRIMAKNALVVRKADALDLPPTTDVVIPVELSPEEKRAYAEMKNVLQTQFSSGDQTTAKNRLTQMLRLRQVTSGHLPDDLGQTHEIGDSKARVIRSIVNDTLLGEPRVVVFCFFVHEIEKLARTLSQQRGTEVMKISGDTSTMERERIRRRFGTDPEKLPQRMVMVCQIKTMSLAVNELVTANHAVFGSLSQQRDDLIQAKDRLDRIGQTKPCTFWFALAPGTVDEVILRSHRDRTDLEEAMLRHIAGAELAEQTEREQVSA